MNWDCSIFAIGSIIKNKTIEIRIPITRNFALFRSFLEIKYPVIIGKEKIATNEFDSLNTVNELKEFLFLDNKPLNFETHKTPNSQDLPNIVKLNFAINILKTEDMYKNKSLIGKNPYLYNLDEIEGLDINTEFEFSYAEYLFKKKYE